MKAMSDYPKSLVPNENTAYGTFKDETQPGAGDGTDIKAAQMQDLYYALYQVLGLAGVTPNGELENNHDSKQFLNSLANISWLKYDSSLIYNQNSIALNTVNNITTAYRSIVNNNTLPLDNVEAWRAIFTIDVEQHFQICGGMGANSLPVGTIITLCRNNTPAGFLRLNGSEYPRENFIDFYDNYLTTGKVITVDYNQWNKEFNDFAGNVGYFGINTGAKTFKVPCIQQHTFIASSCNEGGGGYFWDQSVNISAYFGGNDYYGIGNAAYAGNYIAGAGATTGLCNTHRINFDSNRVVRCGDRVQPRHICYPFFIYVGE